jgi:hypothetical protein
MEKETKDRLGAEEKGEGERVRLNLGRERGGRDVEIRFPKRETKFGRNYVHVARLVEGSARGKVRSGPEKRRRGGSVLEFRRCEGYGTVE